MRPIMRAIIGMLQVNLANRGYWVFAFNRRGPPWMDPGKNGNKNLEVEEMGGWLLSFA